MRVSSLAQSMALIGAACLLGACNEDQNDTIVRDVTPPLITFDNDAERHYAAVTHAAISGEVTDNTAVASLTYRVNDGSPKSIAVDGDGQFADQIWLDAGDNKVVFTAADSVGNQMVISRNFYLGDILAAGNSHTGVLRDGQLYGFGRNNFGQTGLGVMSKLADSAIHPSTPILMPSAPKDLISINYNQNHSLAIDDSGQVYSWGEDKYGQLGRGENGYNNCSRHCRLDIDKITTLDDALMISAGYKHNLVLTKEGDVWAMGYNKEGQLGDGTTSNSSTPVKVDFSGAQNVGHIIQVVASSDSSYALDDRGQVWGWGSDSYANMGGGSTCKAVDGCTNTTSTPVRITVIPEATSNEMSGEKVSQLAAGRDHVLALTNQGSVYGWGLNASSQVGYNGLHYQGTNKAWDDIVTTPTRLPWFTDKTVRRIYANGNASYTLLEDGTVYPWGMYGETRNVEGQDRTVYDNLDEPSNKLPSLKNVDNMTMGAMHLLAREKPTDLTPYGSLFTWGWSFEGSLGNALATNIWMYNTPIAVTLPNAQ